MQRAEIGHDATRHPFGLSRASLVTAAVVVLLGAKVILPFGGWETFYVPFAFATVLVVRSVPAAPGSLLRRQATRRALVTVLGVACLGLVLATPIGPAPTGVIPWLMLVVVLVNVALGQATRRIAAAPDDAVDEREEQVRNRVHRDAYWLFTTKASCLWQQERESASASIFTISTLRLKAH